MSRSEWLQLGTTVGTLLLAGAALLQIRSARRQLDAARAATEAALASVREATRARVDDQAPRVTLYPEPPSLMPFVDRERRGMPMANELRLLDPTSVSGSEVARGEFVFPEAKDWFLWFAEHAVIINEGVTTARVRIEGEAQFVTGASPLFPDLGEIALPPICGSGTPREHLLAPRSAGRIEWAFGHTLEGWARAYADSRGTEGHMHLVVNVASAVGDGIVDKLYLEAGARPLEPVPGRDSHWRIAQEIHYGASVYPTDRYHLVEGWNPKPPPWAHRFRDADE